jgi:hypothetical protein
VVAAAGVGAASPLVLLLLAPLLFALVFMLLVSLLLLLLLPPLLLPLLLLLLPLLPPLLKLPAFVLLLLVFGRPGSVAAPRQLTAGNNVTRTLLGRDSDVTRT